MNRALLSFAACLISQAVAALVPAVVVAGVGWVWVGDGAGQTLAVLAGVAASWVASLAGAVPVALALSTEPKRAVNAALASTAVRFLVVLALAAPLLLGGWFPRTTFAAALAGSYLMMLLVDSLMAVRMIRRYAETTPA